jgi:hypothetical protein
LISKEKERESVIQDILVLILDTNLHILRNTQIAGAVLVDDEVYNKSEELKKKFFIITDSIKEITKEYEMVLDMTNEFKARTQGDSSSSHND